MQKSLLIAVFFVFGITASQSTYARKMWVSVKIDNATVKVKGDEIYVKGFLLSLDHSEESAVNYLLDTKWTLGRKCRIIDKSIEGSKFTADGSVKSAVKAWKEWRWLAES
ncbi:hypothetical protein [Marinoscillum pacificum]|uniref:hypothetical protein n=1 Tax=Marinoscillum pacificum TaxID=392723 RepID=UPI0021581A03|nr:hypothetical protein [Marinoscillum pacificum]